MTNRCMRTLHGEFAGLSWDCSRAACSLAHACVVSVVIRPRLSQIGRLRGRVDWRVAMGARSSDSLAEWVGLIIDFELVRRVAAADSWAAKVTSTQRRILHP